MQKDHKTLGVKSTGRALDPNSLCELRWVVRHQPKMTEGGRGSAGLHMMNFPKPS